MKILVFGATGSIGQTLLKTNKKHEIVGISYFKNEVLAKKIIKDHKVKYYFSPISNSLSNVENEQELIDVTNPDLIVNAITGFDGLKYTILALKNKIDIALANKESLVIAGKFINEIAKQQEVNIYPIDSEHTSLMEMFMRYDVNDIKQLIITCSGGRCYNMSDEQKSMIKFDEAIKHPNWSMGSKISLDSTTLMNKCFEIIEAYHLFATNKIKAIYHPQSIVHSLIEFKDNSFIANMSKPDMAISIDLAINKFNKNNEPLIDKLDLLKLRLDFDEIDTIKWKPIKWAYEAINDKNGSLGCILCYANEVAIDLFKQDRINLLNFYDVIEKFIDKFKNTTIKDFDDLFKLIDKMKKFDPNI